MSKLGGMVLAAALFAVADVAAQPQALACVTESGAPCRVDARHPVSGREAERNWRRANREQTLPEGARVLDMRNGRFVVTTRPTFREVAGDTGYCTVSVQDTRWFRPVRYVHAPTSRTECEREADAFAQGGMEEPLNGPNSIYCETSDAYWCFAALNEVREAVARVGQDENARVAGYERDRQRNLATARSMASMSRPFVYSRLDGSRWGCARIGQNGSGFGDTEVLACSDLREDGQLSTAIYVSGPYQY